MRRLDLSLCVAFGSPSLLLRYHLGCGVESRLQDLAVRLVARLFALVVLDEKLEDREEFLVGDRVLTANFVLEKARY